MNRAGTFATRWKKPSNEFESCCKVTKSEEGLAPEGGGFQFDGYAVGTAASKFGECIRDYVFLEKHCTHRATGHPQQKNHTFGMTRLRKSFQLPSGCFCQTVKYRYSPVQAALHPLVLWCRPIAGFLRQFVGAHRNRSLCSVPGTPSSREIETSSSTYLTSN